MLTFVLYCSSTHKENGAGGPLSGAGEDSGQGAGGLEAQTQSEGAGAAEHEKPDVRPAGRL